MSDKNDQLYLGCISGTSVDGLDVALISLDHHQSVSILGATTIKLPAQLREQLLSLGNPGHDDLPDLHEIAEIDVLGQCDTDLGVFIGTSLRAFLETHKLSTRQITAIGSHGQTVRHRPPDERRPLGFTTQIGDPNQIAEITGIQTVADFRRRDMAAGGHGAPLVPPFHQILFQHAAANTVVLNIGGISNISILGTPTTGFDTGPGNALMDNWSIKHLGKPYDEDGTWGASGQIDQTESLSKKMVRGGGWLFSMRFVNRGLNFVRTLILARMLAPDDFGLLGIALLSISILENFSETGFQAALVQKKENITIHLGRGNQVRIRMVLTDESSNSYLEDQVARHDLYQAVIDKKVIALTTNKSWENYDAKVQEQKLGVLAARNPAGGSTSRDAL